MRKKVWARAQLYSRAVAHSLREVKVRELSELESFGEHLFVSHAREPKWSRRSELPRSLLMSPCSRLIARGVAQIPRDMRTIMPRTIYLAIAIFRHNSGYEWSCRQYPNPVIF